MVNSIGFGRVLLLGLLVATTWPADQAASQEGSSYLASRCNNWSSQLNDFERWLYMNGLLDGLLFNNLEIQEIRLPEMLSTGDAVQHVNWLCTDPANTNIPIPFVLKVAAMRAHGLRQDLIDNELSRLRALF